MIITRSIQPEQTHQLRHQVLRPHQTLAEMTYPHDHDEHTIHFGSFTFETTEPVGIVTLALNPVTTLQDADINAAWQLRGMATRPQARGTGAGKALVTACINHITNHTHPDRTIWCNARLSALGFYECMGFVTLSKEFDIPGIGPHHVMKHQP
jgi:predicted GNAT family N-acyltransferase